MSNYTNANFGHRLIATLTDFSLGAFISSALLLFIASSLNFEEMVFRLLLTLLFFLSPFGLFLNIGLPYYFQATLGKMLTGLKISDIDNKPLPFKMLFFRQTVGYLFSGTLFGLGYLNIFKDPEKRTWHDKATNSKVVVTQNIWFVGLIAFLIFVGGSGYLVYQSIQRMMHGPLTNELQNLIQSYKEERKNTQQLKNQEFGLPDKTPEVSVPVSAEFLKSQEQVYAQYDKKDYQKALEEVQKLQEMAKTQNEKGIAKRVEAEILYAENKLPQARVAGLEALKLVPKDVFTYGILTQIELDQKNYPKAIEYAQKTIELDPKVAVYHNDLGVALFDSGTDKKKGLEEVKKAIELDPDKQLFKDNLKQMEQSGN